MEEVANLSNEPPTTSELEQKAAFQTICDKNKANKRIASISVDQLLKSIEEDGTLAIYGQQIHHINMVVRVRQVVDTDPSKLNLMVCDPSSECPIEITVPAGKSFNDLDVLEVNTKPMGASRDCLLEVKEESGAIVTDDYVRIIGAAQYDNGRPSVVAHHICKIGDPNEMIVHALEIKRDSLYYRSSERGGSNSSAPPDGPNPLVGKETRVLTQESSASKLSAIDKRLATYIGSTACEEGLHLNDICSNFPTLERSEIVASLAVLANEGIVWQGDDVNMWCIG